MPNVLLVYPKFPPAYWGFNFALPMTGKKAVMPPLGLLTVAGLFPKDYHLRVLDINVEPLTDTHLQWADIVFTSAMIVQRQSLMTLAQRCNQAQVPIVAGGPYITSYHEDIRRAGEATINYFLLGEVEDYFLDFLTDLRLGIAKNIYEEPRDATGEIIKPPIDHTPLPAYHLIDLRAYAAMALQFSRGCPFKCAFCDIPFLFGKKTRTKSNEQMLKEFEYLYRLGWSGSLFLVDDNFAGNWRNALAFLPSLAEWQKERNYPFSLFTEASVDIVKYAGLLDAMADTGFGELFLGIETTKPETLITAAKRQNVKKKREQDGFEEDHLFNVVRMIQRKGMSVSAGLIVGLDGDDERVFDEHYAFIQKAGIPLAMIGFITALKDTPLYLELKEAGRLLEESNGNNTSIDALNIKTSLGRDVLVEGFKRLTSTAYDRHLKNYFERCLTLFEHLTPTPHNRRAISKTEWLTALRSLRYQLFSRHGIAYARFFATVIRRYPRMISEAFRLAVMGYHFEKITSNMIAADEFPASLEK